MIKGYTYEIVTPEVKARIIICVFFHAGDHYLILALDRSDLAYMMFLH